MINKEIKNTLLEIIEDLEDYDISEPFKEPVDWLKLGLLDYPEIVKTPMDLSTVRSKLKEDKYKKIMDVKQDIQLIWNNCMKYNVEDSVN